MEMFAGLDTFARRFFREPTGQYKGIASDIVPTFEMLIAVNHEQQSYLFRWVHNRVVVWLRHFLGWLRCVFLRPEESHPRESCLRQQLPAGKSGGV